MTGAAGGQSQTSALNIFMNETLNHSQSTVDVELGGQKGPESHGSTRVPATAINFHQLDALIPTVSARILKASSETLDEVIQNSLQEILQLLGLGRGGLLHGLGRDSAKSSFAMLGTITVSRWCPMRLTWRNCFHGRYQQLVLHGSTVAIASLGSLPEEAETDRQSLIQIGVQSALTIPLLIGERVHHLFSVNSLKKEWSWPEPFITSLRLLGEIFVSALERRDILRSLEIYQARLDVAAASAGAGLWEIDLVTGNIWTTNSAREMFNFAQEEQITYSSLLEKIHPEDRSLVTETVESAQSLGLESQVEYRVPQADGAMRWLISRGRVRQNGAGAAKIHGRRDGGDYRT